MGIVFQLSDCMPVCVDVLRAVSQGSERMQKLGIWVVQLEIDSF